MKKLIFTIVLFSFVFISCEKEEPKTNNDSVLTKANIKGSVLLYDEFGNPVSKERMMVYMESSSAVHWAETEKDGSFLVPNVPYFNNYSIAYEKDGYGTYKIFGFDHQYTGEEGEISLVSLGQKSSAFCSSLVVTQSNDTTHFHLSLDGGSYGGKRRVRLLFHTISEISNEVFSHYTSKFIANNPQPVISLSKEYLTDIVGLVSGQTYFVQAYGESFLSNAYFDDGGQKQVLPNLGWDTESGTPTGSFIMP